MSLHYLLLASKVLNFTSFKLSFAGLFGMTILIILMFPMYYIHVPHTFSTNPEGRLEDVFYAWEEIKEVPTIALALSGTVIR